MQIYWCKVCGKCHPNSGWEDEEEIAEREKCRTEHKNISVLKPVVDDSCVSEQPVAEPVRTAYFYAVDQDGKKWVVKKWRTDVNEPLAYKIFEGRIATWTEKISVQEEAIRQQLKDLQIKEFHENFLIGFLKNQIPFVKYDTEMVVEGDNPLEIEILLNQRMVSCLIAQFDLLEGGQAFREFISKENVPGGVLPFRDKRNFRIV